MVPVILDTDIGVDIDDHFAVALLLGSPEFDIRLITVSSGDIEHRADLLTQLLVEAGRTDVPIALGLPSPQPLGLPVHIMPVSGSRYRWRDYPGPTSLDGAGEIVRVVTSSADPVTIISICQMTTIAAALERDPGIVANSRIVSMSACLVPQRDANAACDAEAYRRVLASGW
jgi:inosine-uridine nucleoside N-ribohydrolase